MPEDEERESLVKIVSIEFTRNESSIGERLFEGRKGGLLQTDSLAKNQILEKLLPVELNNEACW